MTYTAIILKWAKTVGVSGKLLLAICSYESNLTNVVVYHDGGSPSYGICQVKYGTAQMLGFKGKAQDLVDPRVNAKWAALYLKSQIDRYDGDWCKAAAAYNAGTFNESKKFPGKPRNLKYIRRIQAKLPEALRPKLSCEAEK
jgi:soluble lytic murein transglycosylase-like protein